MATINNQLQSVVGALVTARFRATPFVGAVLHTAAAQVSQNRRDPHGVLVFPGILRYSGILVDFL